MKRLVICCDGTWNVPDRTDRGLLCPSNVAKMALAVSPLDANGIEQRIFYGKGVGTGVMDRRIGGLFGWGLTRHIMHAYRFLLAHYEPGDEIYLFGFSRGAYTVRSLAGLVRNSGILRRDSSAQLTDAYRLYRRRDDASHPEDIEARLFRKAYAYEPRIRFIGVWDTVGGLGIPMPVSWLQFLTRWWQFHDVKLSSYVDNAYQALAIDERRKPFLPTLWEQQPHAVDQHMVQAWFAGVHSNVGGGYADSGLADIAFSWVQEKAEACGLALDDEYLRNTIHPNYRGELRDSRIGFYTNFPPVVRPIGSGVRSNEVAHASSVDRMQQADYAPPNLQLFLSRGGPVAPSSPDLPS